MGSEIIELPDGRLARRENGGRCREIATGKWISAADVRAAQPDVDPGGDSQPAVTPRDQIELAALQAARSQGLQAASASEVFAGVIGVQTEIALDKTKPAQATAAARFIARQTNLAAAPDSETEDERPWFILGRELARKVLTLIEEETSRRENE